MKLKLRSTSSRNQQQLARHLARFHVPVRLRASVSGYVLAIRSFSLPSAIMPKSALVRASNSSRVAVK